MGLVVAEHEQRDEQLWHQAEDPHLQLVFLGRDQQQPQPQVSLVGEEYHY